MLLRLIMFVCFYPIALIVFFVLRNEAKPKKNLVLGVTLPHDARQSDQVGTVVRRFLTLENAVMAVLTLTIAPVFILNQDSVMMMWLFSWLLAALILPGIPYAAANRQLKALKQHNNWFGESTGVTLVDVSLAVAPKKKLSPWWFVPAAAITLVPVAHTLVTLRGHDAFWPMITVYLTFFVLTAVLYFLYGIIFRQRAEVVDANTPINAALTQVRRYNWGKSFLLIAWLTAAFDLLLWVFGFDSLAVVLLSVIYSLVLIILLMQAEFKTRKMQQKLTAESGVSVYTDDDDKWLLGMFYYNKNDAHFMINKRTGIGTTMNLARAPGKILIVFTALILLSMPLIGVWMMGEESAAVLLQFDGTMLTASHSGTVYTLDIADIASAELLDVLPDGTRTNGTAFKTVLKGSFSMEGLGACRLCLNPQVPPFIVVTAADGKTYIFGSNDAAITRTVFEQLVTLQVSAGHS